MNLTNRIVDETASLLLIIFCLRYEVHKVQNDNESLMVASGMPMAMGKKLGPRHASEIAEMALDIMDASAWLDVPNKYMARLSLRIGIHSGPAVGAVQKIGDSMPRYNELI